MKFRYLTATGIAFFQIAFVLLPVIARASEADGVKHSVEISLRMEPAPGRQNSLRGSLTSIIRISAHSKIADFSGEIVTAFDRIDLSDAAPFRPIWSQDRCHERRGLPKIWIQKLSGYIIDGDTRIAVLAEPRQIGVLLPRDELRTGQQVETLNDAGRSERILRARSLISHFVLEVKLISTACAL